MLEFPTLYTARLKLRPFSLDDASIVQVLAGHPDVARTTLAIPHPYPDGAAEAWIASHAAQFEQGTSVHFAIERSSDGAVIGAIGLGLEREHARAELGYWVGKPYWGRGYCTEAAQAVVHYGFVSLDLNRIYAHHFTTNLASGRVLQKIGMQYEGRRRQHTLKDGVFLDSDAYGILCNKHERKKEMSVDDFKDLDDILRHFGLRFQFNQFIDLKNPPKIELAPFLLEDLEFGMTHWGTDDKEAFICEFLIVPLLKEAWKRHPELNLFSHVPIQADELKMIPDYLVSAKTQTGWKRLHRPLLLVVEAKDEKFEAGWFQALLQLVICQKINGTNEIPILAIVTTGDLWQFGKLEKDCFVRHPIPLSIRPEELLGILDICFAECEKNARLHSDDEEQMGK